MLKKWIYLKELGNLYIEIILVQFDVPLLFVCNNNGKRYLILCVDEEKGIYISVKIDRLKLINMLLNEIPMADVFKYETNNETYIISYNFPNKSFELNTVLSSEIPIEYLPDEGAYFELRNSKIDKYIASLKEYSYSITKNLIMQYFSNEINKVVPIGREYINITNRKYKDVFMVTLHASSCTTTKHIHCFMIN